MKRERKALKSVCLLLSVCIVSSMESNQQIVQHVLNPKKYGLEKLQFVTPLTTFFENRVDGTKHLTISPEEFQQRILPDSFYEALPECVEYKDTHTGRVVATINPQKGTYLWGYKISDGENTYGPSFPAHTIEAHRYVKTKSTLINNLVAFEEKGHKLCGPLLQKFLTVDQSLMWANPLDYPMYLQCIDTSVTASTTQPCTTACVPDVPTACPGQRIRTEPLPATFLKYGNPGFYAGPQPMVLHLHGAENPSAFDGCCQAWFTPCLKYTGQTYVTNKYVYPNHQQATTLWFHDHVLGETRLNTYAGQAGFYFIRGEPESSVTPHLPTGPYEVEFVLSDRMFDTNGQIFFPDGIPCNSVAAPNGTPSNPFVHPYHVPEFFGNVISVNGKAWPYFDVEPRRYRFRILDASNARMYGLYLENAVVGGKHPVMWQIGSDGGLFDKPVKLDFTPFSWDPGLTCPGEDPYGGFCTLDHFPHARLFLASSERADIIIDFAKFEGETILLKNGCPGPFPGNGTAFNNDIEGNVMQFRVSTKPVKDDDSFNPAKPGATLRKGAEKVVAFTNGKGHLAPGVKETITITRKLILIEQEGPISGGPVTVLLNNTHYDGVNPFTGEPVKDAVSYVDGTFYVTELPQVGSTEIWELINLTPDAHPIHVHLIQFQLLNREIFNVGNILPPYGPPFLKPAYNDNYRYNKYEHSWFGQENPPYPAGSKAGTVYGAGSPLSYLAGSAGVVGGNPSADPYFVRSSAYPYYANPTTKIIPPDPNEANCWKDLIKAFPGTVTRIVIRWAPQDLPIGNGYAGENKFPFDPTAQIGVKDDGFGYPGGPGYVWHCHITDHEDNDMMREFELRYCAQKVPATTYTGGDKAYNICALAEDKLAQKK